MTDEFPPVSETQIEAAPDSPETSAADEGGVEAAAMGEVTAGEAVPLWTGGETNAVRVSTAVPTPTVWQQIRALFLPDRALAARRINDLNRAIDASPDAAGNYVLRGEVYFESQEYELALADFEQGLELAQKQFDESDWGFVAQAVRDRALTGLQKTARKLNKRT